MNGKLEQRAASPYDLAYFAGLFDGEGSVTIDKAKVASGRRSPSYRAQITISNKNEGVLREIQKHYGGSILVKDPQRFPARRYKHSAIYQFGLAARKAAKFLEDVLPFLRIKQQQAIIAIELQRKCARNSNHRRGLRPEELAIRESMYLSLIHI